MAVLFSAFSRGWINTLELAHSGTRVAATVVRLELSNHGGCRYAYSVDARTYTKSDSRCGVSRQIGDPLVVTYLPSNPAVSTTGSPGGNVRNALMISLLVPTSFWRSRSGEACYEDGTRSNTTRREGAARRRAR
jgi:hypothetical protein